MSFYGLTKGISLKICILCVCVKSIKRLFGTFCVSIMFNWELTKTLCMYQYWQRLMHTHHIHRGTDTGTDKHPYFTYTWVPTQTPHTYWYWHPFTIIIHMGTDKDPYTIRMHMGTDTDTTYTLVLTKTHPYTTHTWAPPQTPGHN